MNSSAPPTTSLDPPEPSGDGDMSVVAASAQARGAERNKRIRLAIVSSVLIRPLSLLIPLITVPLFFRYLGGEIGYGLYELVGSVALYLGMTNLGLTMGLINKLTDCHVSGDRALARRYVSTLSVALAFIAIVSAVICTVAAPLLNWTVLFHAQGAIARSTLAWAMWVGGMVTVANLIASLPHSIYFAEQELHRSNVWEGIAKVATLLACLGVVRTPFGIVGVLLAVSGTSVFVRLVNAVDMFVREKPWLRPDLRLFEWPLLRATVSDGILLFALQVANVLLFQVDKLVIGIGVDSASVAGYSIVGRIYIAGYGVFMTLLTPLWPASGEAVRRGDIPWVKRWMGRSLLLGCTLPLLVGLVLMFWGEPILRLYLRGQHVDVSRSIIAALAVTFTFRAWVDCRSIVLNSTGVLVPQLFFYVGHALLNIILAIALVGRFGAAGVAWSTPITAVVTSVWGYPWLIHRYITGKNAPSYAGRVAGADASARQT